MTINQKKLVILLSDPNAQYVLGNVTMEIDKDGQISMTFHQKCEIAITNAVATSTSSQDARMVEDAPFYQNMKGDYIRSLRERKSLTMLRLGGLLGVTRASVSNWEHGLSECSVERELAGALDISHLDFMVGFYEFARTHFEAYQEKWEESQAMPN